MQPQPHNESHRLTDSRERRCILGGASHPADRLLRLAIGPEGQVVPDLGGRLGGRGAWISLDRQALEAALRSGKLRGQLARTLKRGGGSLHIPDGLSDLIGDGLMRRALNRLGLEQKGGNLVFGFDRLTGAAEAGRLHGLLHAQDASAAPSQKLRAQLAKSRPSAYSLTLNISRELLSDAVGRENAVHIGVADQASAARIFQDMARWLDYSSASGEGQQERRMMDLTGGSDR